MNSSEINSENPINLFDEKKKTIEVIFPKTDGRLEYRPDNRKASYDSPTCGGRLEYRGTSAVIVKK